MRASQRSSIEGRARTVLLFFLAALLGSASCERPPKTPAARLGPAVVLRNGAGRDWTVQVELARTGPEKAKGLMFRWSLAPDHGMLFIYPDAAPRQFWMKNTRLPLDMIFIGPDRRIGGIVEKAEPYTESPRAVPAPAQWVLEVGGGEARAHGLQAGDRVYFYNFEP